MVTKKGFKAVGLGSDKSDGSDLSDLRGSDCNLLKIMGVFSENYTQAFEGGIEF